MQLVARTEADKTTEERTVATGGSERRDAHALTSLEDGRLLEARIDSNQVAQRDTKDAGDAEREVPALDCKKDKMAMYPAGEQALHAPIWQQSNGLVACTPAGTSISN
jgi:hypothetical protein